MDGQKEGKKDGREGWRVKEVGKGGRKEERCREEGEGGRKERRKEKREGWNTPTMIISTVF